MESVGTLPCTPEIPDCVEQVRAGGLGPTLLGSNGGTSAAHLAPTGPSGSSCFGFTSLMSGVPRASFEDP